MKKIERNIEGLRKILELMDKLEDEINCLDYYKTNEYFDIYLGKEKNIICNLVETMEVMKNDEDLLNEEE